MTIDEVSRELGRLAQAMEDIKHEFHEHKTEENLWQSTITKQLECLIAKENERKGMMKEASRIAKLWGAAFGAVVVGFIEVLKHWIFGA
jgi:hypothetical protein